VLDTALAAHAPVAVLPCCHNLRLGDTAGLEAWMDGALAVDAMRALRLRAAGYRISLLKIPEEITPQNRLLIGVPKAPAGPLGATNGNCDEAIGSGPVPLLHHAE
jgi:hypothetical protein